MSEWRAAKNQQALARLSKALPAIFPAPILNHALQRSFIPVTPRRAVDSYWRAHPVRADRVARALAVRSGAPAGWTWLLSDDVPSSYRSPPTPFRDPRYARGPGTCCVCGQPVYRFGWHLDLWQRGPNINAAWHAACVVAWDFWSSPSDYDRVLKRIQRHRCAESGLRLWKTAEVDHRVPLFRVWREHRQMAWPDLLEFWGLPNLQVINRDVHVMKCAVEARSRIRNASA